MFFFPNFFFFFFFHFWLITVAAVMSRLGLPGNQLPVTQPQLPPVSALTAEHGARRPSQGPREGSVPSGVGEGPEMGGIEVLAQGRIKS